MNPEEERRAIALHAAVEVASRQQVGKYDGAVIVNIARSFETYLKGDDAS